MENKNLEIGKRIKTKREELGMTQEELGDKLSLNKSTIQRYETGQVKKIKLPVLQAMAEQLKVDPNWLALKSDNIEYISPALEPNATLLSKEHIHLIPVFESVAAGFGAYADNRIVEYMPLYIVSESEAENTIVVKVQGDSMYPKIENGDSIQVLRQDFADNGQVVVIMIDEENAVVKKYEYDKKNKTVKLHSFNPEYKDREFKGIEIEQLRILGVVKKVIKEI